jgi:hypothetical protein
MQPRTDKTDHAMSNVMPKCSTSGIGFAFLQPDAASAGLPKGGLQVLSFSLSIIISHVLIFVILETR